ncbi:MAG: conserved rane protein of unknown function, contains repeat [Nitrospira sp.]|jgi:hypothetical protein|nr:conserved rane protein of unknown function, contains repeat [Nitrospira sp.]
MKTMIAMVIALLSASASNADEFPPRASLGERVVLPPGQIVQGDYVAVGPHVEISGTVNGDVYAAGGEVLMDGVVNGDVILAGAKVTLSGTVSQDARIAGARVTVSGSVGRNMTVGGADVHLTDTAKVRDNLLAAAASMRVAGPVGRDARIGAGAVTVSNEVARDLAVAAPSVHLTEKAMVGRNFRYWSEDAPSIDEGAVVRGSTTQRPLPDGWTFEGARRGLFGVRVLAAVVGFLSTLILGLVLLHIYPLFAVRVTAAMRERPGRSLGWGAMALVGIPLVALSFVVTLFALPVGIVLFALYVATVYLSRVYAVTCLGQFVFRRQPDSSSLTGPFVVGLVLYSILSFIPVIGGLVTLLAVLFGIGALLVTKGELIATLREQNQI